MIYHSLEQLTAGARQRLERHYTVPQRYGTAFHITPPATDVRELGRGKDGPPSLKLRRVKQEMFDALDNEEREHVMGSDLTDVYLTWQLAHLEEIPVQFIRVVAGSSLALTLPGAGLYWLFLEEGARVTVHDAIVGSEQAIQRLFVWQKARSEFLYTALRARTAFLNEKVVVHLLGREATTSVTHLTYAGNKEQADIETRVYHKAPGATSTLTLRAAAQAQARTVYRGLIDVDKVAVGTQGYQSAQGLLLSSRAIIDVLPELAIRTNDVRCSHGVNITHLDAAALFYLRSRGLNSETAREHALRGFFHHQLPLPLALARFLDDEVRQSYGS